MATTFCESILTLRKSFKLPWKLHFWPCHLMAVFDTFKCFIYKFFSIIDCWFGLTHPGKNWHIMLEILTFSPVLEKKWVGLKQHNLSPQTPGVKNAVQKYSLNLRTKIILLQPNTYESLFLSDSCVLLY